MNVHFVFCAKIFSFTNNSLIIHLDLAELCNHLADSSFPLSSLSKDHWEDSVTVLWTDWYLHPFNHSGHTLMWRMFENNELSWITEYKPTEKKKKLVGKLQNRLLSRPTGERFVLTSQFLCTTCQSVKHFKQYYVKEQKHQIWVF